MTTNTILFTVFVIYFGCVYNISAELYNLYGKAGQAYSLQVNLGDPYQVLYFLVDTGSTTSAVASQPDQESDYFRANSSNSICKTGKEVQARYSSGMWWGKLASDYIKLPSLPDIPEVRTDIALITKSENFFMNGQGWQGLLGLAYLPVGAWGEDVVVESWLDSLDRSVGRAMSFQMKLCGPLSVSNATHYGKFTMLDDQTSPQNHNKTFRTPIIRKRWYEVGVIAIRVMDRNNSGTKYESERRLDNIEGSANDVDVVLCQTLNEQKSIVDSGTTNIKIPEVYFKQIVDRLIDAAHASNVLILDDFWYHGEAACWPEPQEWSLPYLAIDLLSADAEDQYFTLEIPSQNYMRVVKARNNTGRDGLVSEYCYELGLAGTKETVLGYTAMEGFEVLFNRSAGWIGFQTSSCGSNTRISGPYNTTSKLTGTCNLYKPHEVAPSIKVAQWALLGVSIIASGVLIYVLAPCVRTVLVKRLTSAQQMSLSQAALVEREAS